MVWRPLLGFMWNCKALLWDCELQPSACLDPGVEFSRQEYWSELPSFSIFPTQELHPSLLWLLHWKAKS